MQCCHCAFSMLAAKVKLMIQIWGLFESPAHNPTTNWSDKETWTLSQTNIIVALVTIIINCLQSGCSLLGDRYEVRSPGQMQKIPINMYLHDFIQNVHFLLTYDFCRYLRKTENKNLLRTFLINVRSFSTFAIILLCMMYICSCSKSKLLRL